MRLVAGVASVGDVDDFVADLEAVGSATGCAVAALDGRYVAGRRHLEAAADRAHRAFARDDAIADDRAIEVLLYAAGRRQIERALEMGVGAGQGPIAVVVDGRGGAEPGDEAAAAAAVRDRLETTAAPGDDRDEALIRAFFGVTDAEVAATDAPLELLVVERVALLAVEK